MPRLRTFPRLRVKLEERQHPRASRRERRGALQVLKEKDREWLALRYPGLRPEPNGVAGRIDCRATYNASTNRFLVLNDSVADVVGGVELRINFVVRISERTHKADSALPALHVQAVEATPDRHFNPVDKSACLCSPFEEREFVEPSFDFRRYLEELVIPFLYGQTYYIDHKRWPWRDYSHGTIGLLQSYAWFSDRIDLQLCLRILRERKDWPTVRSALLQRGRVKGYVPCFCGTKRNIRTCHPDAWCGIELLRQKVRSLRVNLR